jgi:hypothetical protein
MLGNLPISGIPGFTAGNVPTRAESTGIASYFAASRLATFGKLNHALISRGMQDTNAFSVVSKTKLAGLAFISELRSFDLD